MNKKTRYSDREFSSDLLAWYTVHGRQNLPWKQLDSPYHIWISEVMLQQTQVETVIPYYWKFIRKFPDMRSLANAEVDSVLSVWAGLGYYARARNLHRAARIIRDDRDCEFPRDFGQLLSLPGIGRSTAGAIMAFSYNLRYPILDGNVKRVLMRIHAIDGDPGARETQALLWKIADAKTPGDSPGDYNQAIMDLGAMICKRAAPSCLNCPVRNHCQAYQSQAVADYPRKIRRAKRPVRSCRMLLISRPDGDVLLQKRPPHGIWGGLWSLPQMDDPKAGIRRFCAESLELEVATWREMDMLRHHFTHYELLIHPVVCSIDHSGNPTMDEERFLWYNRNLGQDAGIPTAVERIFKNLESTENK